MITRILDAARQLKPWLDETPTLPSPLLSKRFGIDLWLKLECDAMVGSFKGRGAFRCLMERTRAGHAGFATASSGNHGTAVAYASRQLGVPAHVFVPRTASPRKIELISCFTSNLVLTESDFDAAKETAADFAARNGLYFIDDGADETIVEGTGTIALEVLRAVTPEVVLVPVGNGALICGIASVFKALCPATRVIGIQPETAPTMYQSWKERRPVSLAEAHSIADGLVSRVAVPEAVQLMNSLIDDMWLVSEDELRAATRLFVETEARVIEPSSAAPVAVLGRPELRGRKVAAIITGRNIETAQLQRLL